MPRVRYSDVGQRFWRRVALGPGCWEWTGAKFRNGYGQFRMPDGRTGYAHRRSYELHHGPIPAGAVVMHSCDRPGCVNPDHLRAGSHLENQRDKVAKGRQCRGEARPLARLTDHDVIDLRSLHSFGADTNTLAGAYGVSPSAVWQAVAHKTWRHVP